MVTHLGDRAPDLASRLPRYANDSGGVLVENPIPQMSDHCVWPACIQGETVQYQAIIVSAIIVREPHPVPLVMTVREPLPKRPRSYWLGRGM